MMDTVAPWLRKALAVMILAVAVWAVTSALVMGIRARLVLHDEIGRAREIHDALAKRRIDLASLEAQVAALTQSGAQHPGLITAADERSAGAQLQQATLKKIKEAGGTALALDGVGLAGGSGSATVALQLRARMAEKAVPAFLAAVEAEGSAWFKDLSASVRNQANQPAEIEISATLRALWMRQDKRPP
jgi:hypothetical protein